MRNKIKAVNGLQLLVFPNRFPRRVSRWAMRCSCPLLSWGKTNGGNHPAPCFAVCWAAGCTINVRHPISWVV